MTEEEREKRRMTGVDAWEQWVEANRSSIVDRGAPLGRTRRATVRGITDTKNTLCAYVVVQAESLEAAAGLFENHPHFTIFPGEAVEVMECLPIPDTPE